MSVNLNLQELFGGIDIYLFDQLLRGRIVPGMRVLDAGCGGGRNIVYLLRSGFEVCGVDEAREAIDYVRKMAETLREESGRMGEKATRTSSLRPQGEVGVAHEEHAGCVRSQEDFRVEAVEQMSWEDESFEVVLSSAVLHFARSQEHWQAMMNEMWRVLRPGGIFFARLASSIGIADQVRLLEGRRYRLPDGSDRFLVDEEMLLRTAANLGGEFLDPIKTTVVQNLRAMTTIVWRKGLGA